MKNVCAMAMVLLLACLHLRAEPGTPGSGFEGTWTGSVTAPNATASIGFVFAQTAKGLTARFSMPAMFVSELPLGPANILDDTYTLPELGVRLARKGEKLEGTFGNPLLRVSLQRGASLPEPMAAKIAPEGPAPVWTKSLGAQVWASPVAEDGVVYVGSVDGKFHALRAATGEEDWTWSGPHALYGTALVAADSLCFLDQRGDCVALDRASGKLRWRTALGTGESASGNPTFNHRTPTPTRDGDELFVGSSNGRVYALDAATGDVRWKIEIGAPVFASVTLDGGELLVAAYDGTIATIDRQSRREVRRVKLGGPVVSAARVSGDLVLVGCRDYLLYGLKRADLTIAWRDSYWFSWIESVPVIRDGVAYIGGSDYRRISAIDPATGTAIWATDVGGLTWGTPVVTDDSVYAGASAQDPAAIQHRGGITALDRRTGAVKWRYGVPLPRGADRAGFIGSLTLADGKLIGAAYDGTMVALPVKD
jgi:outer membrane protein assembly factor BamB